MLRLLFEVESAQIHPGGENEVSALLKCHQVYFIPVVNLDGFHEINELWGKEHELEYVRKNMHKS